MGLIVWQRFVHVLLELGKKDKLYHISTVNDTSLQNFSNNWREQQKFCQNVMKLYTLKGVELPCHSQVNITAVWHWIVMLWIGVVLYQVFLACYYSKCSPTPAVTDHVQVTDWKKCDKPSYVGRNCSVKLLSCQCEQTFNIKGEYFRV